MLSNEEIYSNFTSILEDRLETLNIEVSNLRWQLQNDNGNVYILTKLLEKTTEVNAYENITNVLQAIDITSAVEFLRSNTNTIYQVVLKELLLELWLNNPSFLENQK